MNPVLLKPSSETGAQVVLLGKPVSCMDVGEYHDYQRVALPAVEDALLRLRGQFDLVILEGAGSPAEINLLDRDIANMKAAEMADAPVILVGDIERGGVFASLYGTVALLPESARRRIKGIVINKFRGDEALLDSGIDFLSRECGCPVLGILPFLPNLTIEEEDSLSLDTLRGPIGDAPRADVAVLRLPHISNFTDFDTLLPQPDLRVRFVRSVDEWFTASRTNPDLAIVPGTKSTVDDLRWLRETGLADLLARHARSGGKILGICGGYQMLGRTILDPEGVETRSPASAGLGLLDVDTTFRPDKTLRRVSGAGSAGWLEGAEIVGYEIHHGESARGDARHLISLSEGLSRFDGAIDESGRICGAYVHGLFDTPSCRAALRRWLGLPHIDETEDRTAVDAIDRLVSVVEAKLDMNAVMAIIGL